MAELVNDIIDVNAVYHLDIQSLKTRTHLA